MLPDPCPTCIHEVWEAEKVCKHAAACRRVAPTGCLQGPQPTSAALRYILSLKIIRLEDGADETTDVESLMNEYVVHAQMISLVKAGKIWD